MVSVRKGIGSLLMPSTWKALIFDNNEIFTKIDQFTLKARAMMENWNWLLKRQVLLISGHSTHLKEIIFGAHSVPNFPTSFLRLVLVGWCHLVSWKYDSNDDVIMSWSWSLHLWAPQWKAELLDANHHVGYRWCSASHQDTRPSAETRRVAADGVILKGHNTNTKGHNTIW